MPVSHMQAKGGQTMANRLSVQQRRLELEQEVASLHKMLEKEEKVHEVLQKALLPQRAGSTLHIPNFLPKKTKELLAELVIVEEEITGLEDEISKVKKRISDEQEARAEELVKCNQSKYVTASLLLNQPSVPPTQALKSGINQANPAVETKPLFFLNRAIKGDYFATHALTAKTKNSEQNHEKKVAQTVGGFHGRVSRKSEVIENLSSPRIHPRFSTPQPMRHSFEDSSKLSSSSKNSQNWHPNRLSEKIMKCLICIYLRLLRTSRQNELEKSGSLSKSIHSSLGSRSFRADSSLNPISTLMIQKELRQSDPYGIFEIEDSILRDIGPYKNLVKFTASSFDPKGISTALPLLNELRALVNSLHEVDLKYLNHQQKLAFWINIYNACIMHGFLVHGLPSNPEKLLAMKNKAVLIIGGNKLSALAIEHFILRQPSNIRDAYWNNDKEGKEADVRNTYGLEHPEPNVTFALCSGSRSSPAMRIYTAEGISSELERAKLEYLQASIVVTSSKRLMIPKLLVLNMHDFAGDLDSLVDWICNQLPASGSLRKSTAECLKSQSYTNVSEFVDVIPLDCKFQYLFPL